MNAVRFFYKLTCVSSWRLNKAVSIEIVALGKSRVIRLQNDVTLATVVATFLGLPPLGPSLRITTAQGLGPPVKGE